MSFFCDEVSVFKKEFNSLKHMSFENPVHIFEKVRRRGWVWWLRPVIPAILEAEMEIQGPPRQKAQSCY
jgi:hypothetical protein